MAHHVGGLAGQFPERGPHPGQVPDVEESLAFPEAGAHPVVVVLQVAAAPAAGERPAPGADRPDRADELGQVVGEGHLAGGVVLVARATGQPGLHRPRERVAGARLAQGDGRGHREPGRGGELPGGRCLGLQFPAGHGGVCSLQGEPRGEPVTEAEDGVDRAGGGDAADVQAPPLRELGVDQVAHHGGVDGKFAGVHGHDG